jgi:hypothetical protein
MDNEEKKKLTDRDRIVELCNEFASLSKEDREAVLTRLHGLHEYHIRLDRDIEKHNKEKENQTK